MPDDLPQLDTLGDTVDFFAECRNDLEPAAQAVTPAVGATLAAIRDTAPLLARMSGSGATCFGVYSNTSDAMAGAEAIAQAHPDWWVRNTVLGSQGALNEPRLLDAGDHIVSEIN
jgi:4-diphosphocytidyl-2-C-methyl-D-erythritol kinase